MAVLDLQPGEIVADSPVPLRRDGDRCAVIDGTHKGKSGIVRDIKTSKTGQITITVVQDEGERFKTLAKNVTIVRK